MTVFREVISKHDLGGGGARIYPNFFHLAESVAKCCATQSEDGQLNSPSVGMSRKQVISILGKPSDPKANPLEYKDGAKNLKVFLNEKGKLLRVTETLPGGAETIIVK